MKLKNKKRKTDTMKVRKAERKQQQMNKYADRTEGTHKQSE